MRDGNKTQVCYTTHSNLLSRLGFKVRFIRHTGNDVHLSLTSVNLSLQEPILLDDPTTVKARLFKQLPDSCINVTLSFL